MDKPTVRNMGPPRDPVVEGETQAASIYIRVCVEPRKRASISRRANDPPRCVVGGVPFVEEPQEAVVEVKREWIFTQIN